MGITTIAMIFVKTVASFYILRFRLGSFEAGLWPGGVLYLTYWFPARWRAQMVALFATSVPLSAIFGSPISGWIMGAMAGVFGLANWQWLFVLEGIPSIIVGLLALLVVADQPEQARWLSEHEKWIVLADLDEDRRQAGPREHGFRTALKSPRVWLLGVIYFCTISANVTIPFWVPTIIQSLGVKSTFTIGILSTVPSICTIIAMVLVSRHSDRTGERRYHAALPSLACAVGLVGIGAFGHSPALAFSALVLAVMGTLPGQTVFWQMPTMLLAGTAAAGGIALTNSLGALSGWVGPSVVGWLENVTGKTATGLYVVARFEVLGAILILLFVPRRQVSCGRTSNERGEMNRFV
jgi:MFS family permease